jgi:hypothetical protein
MENGVASNRFGLGREEKTRRLGGAGSSAGAEREQIQFSNGQESPAKTDRKCRRTALFSLRIPGSKKKTTFFDTRD